MGIKEDTEQASGDPDTGKIEENKEASHSAKDAVYAMLGSQLRTTLSDGRVVEGKLQCMDRLTNFILADAIETTKLPGVSNQDEPIKTGQGERIASERNDGVGVQQRHLGLVMIPGKHLISVHRLGSSR